MELLREACNWININVPDLHNSPEGGRHCSEWAEFYATHCRNHGPASVRDVWAGYVGARGAHYWRPTERVFDPTYKPTKYQPLEFRELTKVYRERPEAFLTPSKLGEYRIPPVPEPEPEVVDFELHVTEERP